MHLVHSDEDVAMQARFEVAALRISLRGNYYSKVLQARLVVNSGQ